MSLKKEKKMQNIAEYLKISFFVLSVFLADEISSVQEFKVIS